MCALTKKNRKKIKPKNHGAKTEKNDTSALEERTPLT